MKGLTFLALSAILPAQAAETLDPTIVDAERIEDEISAVSVLSRDSLDLFQSRSFSDLSGLVPGFHVVSPDSRGYGSVVAMRGSTNTLFFGPPALGLMIDDLPLGDAYTYPSELLELAEVRVHRGPQGPYFGRNGAAGMVEMFTLRPGDTHRTSFTAEYGSYDHLGLGLSSSGPLGGDLSYSAQLFHSQRDGFIRNALLGGEFDDRESTGGLLNLFWNPSDDFELRFRFFAEQVDDGTQRLSRLDSPDLFTVNSDNPGRTDLERYQLSLHSRKDLAAGTLETIHSFQTWELDPSTVDLDLADRTTPSPAFNGGFPFPADARSLIFQSQDLISNEIRFSSPDDHAFRWQAGLFQMWTSNGGLTQRTQQVRLPPPAGPFTPVLNESISFEVDQLNLAAFSNLAWDIRENLTLDAGLRVDYHESEIQRLKRDNLAATATPVNGSRNEWFVSPVLGLTYEVHPTLDAFVRTSIGNKPGGWSAYADAPANAEFKRETNWSNEIGLQYDNPDQNLRVGLRAFWDQIDDYQFNQGINPFSTDFIVFNADEVTSKGIELDAAWAPVDRLTVRASFGYTDAEFDSYFDPFTGTLNNGNKVPFVPEYTGSAGIRYRFDCGFYAQTSARIAGPTRYDAANTTTFSQDAWVVWDAEIGYETEHFTVALFGRNLLDEEYYTFINPQIFAGAPGDPQLFGARIRTTF